MIALKAQLSSQSNIDLRSIKNKYKTNELNSAIESIVVNDVDQLLHNSILRNNLLNLLSSVLLELETQRQINISEPRKSQQSTCFSDEVFINNLKKLYDASISVSSS